MYLNHRIALVVPVLDEVGKIEEVLQRVPRDVVDSVLVVDDGSKDGSAELARRQGAVVISLHRTLGVGAALREGFRWVAEREFDVVAVCAGNNKDAPEELTRLLDPICRKRADFVQGSRFLLGGRRGNMPLYRRVATRIHPLVFSVAARKNVSESTNGYRAFRASILRDPRIRLDQDWLDGYELEPYLYWKVIRLGYVTAEAPVSKIYPARHLGYTKMRPITGWWSILRPVFLLALGLRK